jgi:UDP-N-acetyl-alpha-D-quinovosamine dehydrogenase
MTNILVTGASGFIGKPLVNLLIEKGNYVRAVCRSVLRVDAVENKENYEWQRYDLLDENIDYGSLLENIDVVIHLAAQVHVMDGLTKEIQDGYRKINTRGTEILAREAAKRGVKRFIFLSTIKVNGEGSDNRMMSAGDTPNPQDPYAVSKYDAEQALRNVGKEIGMEYVILRPPLVYGPGVRANFLRLLKLISRRYPLPFGAIDNLRSLIYVENLADIISVCTDKQAAANKIYMVKDIDISTPNLIEAIATAFGHRARLIPVPSILLKLVGVITGKKSAIERLTGSLVVDDSPVRNELGWTPPYDSDKALETTVNWYREKQEK